MSDNTTWLCATDINHDSVLYPRLSEFPVEKIRAAAPAKGTQRAKRMGYADDADMLAMLQKQAAADFETELKTLIDSGSLKTPEDILPKSDIAAQLRAAQARIAELEQLKALEEAGVPEGVRRARGRSSTPVATPTPAEPPSPPQTPAPVAPVPAITESPKN